MKKRLIFVAILVNLIFGVQGFSEVTSKNSDKVIEKVIEEYDKGNKQKAMSMLKENILKNPSNLELKVFLGMMYEDMGKKKEAEKELNEVVALQKKYPFINFSEEKIRAIRHSTIKNNNFNENVSKIKKYLEEK